MQDIVHSYTVTCPNYPVPAQSWLAGVFHFSWAWFGGERGWGLRPNKRVTYGVSITPRPRNIAKGTLWVRSFSNVSFASGVCAAHGGMSLRGKQRTWARAHSFAAVTPTVSHRKATPPPPPQKKKKNGRHTQKHNPAHLRYHLMFRLG